MTVTQDATSGMYIPQSATEWTALLSGSGLSNPSHLYLPSTIASGSITDVIGSLNLSDPGYGTQLYQQTVFGWSTKAIVLPQGVQSLMQQSGFGIQSMMAMAWVVFPASLGSAELSAMTLGAIYGQQPALDLKPSSAVEARLAVDGTVDVDGTHSYASTVQPVILQGDITNNVNALVTPLESLTNSTALPSAPQGFIIGGDNNNTWYSAGCGYLYIAVWDGAAAEINATQRATLLSLLVNGPPATSGSIAGTATATGALTGSDTFAGSIAGTATATGAFLSGDLDNASMSGTASASGDFVGSSDAPTVVVPNETRSAMFLRDLEWIDPRSTPWTSAPLTWESLERERLAEIAKHAKVIEVEKQLVTSRGGISPASFGMPTVAFPSMTFMSASVQGIATPLSVAHYKGVSDKTSAVIARVDTQTARIDELIVRLAQAEALAEQRKRETDSARADTIAEIAKAKQQVSTVLVAALEAKAQAEARAKQRIDAAETVAAKARKDADLQTLARVIVPMLPSCGRFDVVVEQHGKWFVFNELQTRILGGPYTSKAEAEKRLEQIEYFKAHKKDYK